MEIHKILKLSKLNKRKRSDILLQATGYIYFAHLIAVFPSVSFALPVGEQLSGQSSIGY